jgi:hypothetical protein
MNFHDLPDDIISLIMFFRKIKTAAKKATEYIQAHWFGYRTRVLLGRFKMLKYLKEFREFNPSLKIFLIKSRL